ncbi:MAG: 3-oxoacyl-[acyl-carrier-protein] reductase FabG [Chlamydiales bacterium]|nr:3-oxoacyl-[acyl-carrier-protein] reductase FabG [Chlamydiales bacterium]
MRPILVTGGAQGFGAEICRQLANQGHDVVIHYRNSVSQANQVAKECQKLGVKAEVIQGDFLAIEPFIEEYLTRFSQTKGLVNNVGNYLIAPLSQTELSAWRALFETNFFAPLSLTQALIPMLKKVQGTIVNIGTCGLSTQRPLMHASAYAATKSSLLFYTRCLAKELAPSHVRVNMVSPGILETSIDSDQMPMGRRARLEEAASAVVFFFAESSRYITGQNLDVAGGYAL